MRIHTNPWLDSGLFFCQIPWIICLAVTNAGLIPENPADCVFICLHIVKMDCLTLSLPASAPTDPCLSPAFSAHDKQHTSPLAGERLYRFSCHCVLQRLPVTLPRTLSHSCKRGLPLHCRLHIQVHYNSWSLATVSLFVSHTSHSVIRSVQPETVFLITSHSNANDTRSSVSQPQCSY